MDDALFLRDTDSFLQCWVKRRWAPQMSLHSAKDRLGWPPLWDMDSSVTESNFLKLSVCRWLYAPWGQWMSTVSHGFVFCAQQPEGCQGLRSGILQQLFVHLGRQWICTGIFFFFHRDHFIILWAQTLPAKRPWFSARKNNIPIWNLCGVLNVGI